MSNRNTYLTEFSRIRVKAIDERTPASVFDGPEPSLFDQLCEALRDSAQMIGAEVLEDPHAIVSEERLTRRLAGDRGVEDQALTGRVLTIDVRLERSSPEDLER